MYFDTHAHYDDKAFDADRDEVLAAAYEAGTELILNAGCDIESSRAALALAQEHDHVYAAVGLHPEELSKLTDASLGQLRTLARHPKCVAIGEIGLDYYWDDTHKQAQRDLFRRQIELALELNKPVIVHDREAHGDALEIVLDYPLLRGVFHCFSGSAEMAEKLLKSGWYLGFDGPVTYKNARKAVEVLKSCPMDRLLTETDCPYLSPVPLRGTRNDSRNLVHIVRAMAEIKGVTAEELAQAAMENGRRLFMTNI